jgi:hypothetical protein
MDRHAGCAELRTRARWTRDSAHEEELAELRGAPAVVFLPHPPVPHEKANVACGLPQVGTCPDRPDCAGTPLPQQGFTRLCIYKAGEASCPSHDYAVGFVAYRSTDDTRSCSPCTGTVTGSCGTEWNLSNKNDCSETAGHDTRVNTCKGISGSSYIDLKNLGPKDLSCVASGGEPMGTVTLAEPITFCCNK